MVTSLCTYRVKSGSEGDFKALLARHWPTLRRVGLAADKPSSIYQGVEEESGSPFFVEILHWKDAEGPNFAHEAPEVMAVWEPMGTLCEERNGRPAMEFPHVDRVDIAFER